MNSAVFDTFVIIKSCLSLRNHCQARTIKREIYFMALAKIKNAVLLTDDEKMHFRAKEVGGVGILF